MDAVTTYVSIEPNGSYGGFCAYLDGRSSPILKLIPGNTSPATRWIWPSIGEAARELLGIFGPGTVVRYREHHGDEWKRWGGN